MFNIKGEPFTTHILRTEVLKDALIGQVKQHVSAQAAKYQKRPHLAVIHVGEHAASKVYIGRKEEACRACGIDFQQITLPVSATQAQLNHEIEKLNENKDVTGIIVQMPLPEHMSPFETFNTILPYKDVDGLNAQNSGRVVMGLTEKTLYPATPLGVLRILDWISCDLKGKDAVMVGRSHLVGRPMADLLGAREATVMVCHKETKSVREHTKKADVVVVATGVPHLLKGDDFKKGAVIIDVGISPSHIPERHILGDVNTESCVGIASFITPVPGGVGPMTVTSLMTNVVDAFCLQHGEKEVTWQIPAFDAK